MKRKKAARRAGQEASFIHGPAMNIVVYRNPGPDDNAIEAHECFRSCVAKT